MYTVYLDNGNGLLPIHGGGANLATAKIEEAKNATPSFDFTIYPQNPGYEQIQPFISQIYVYNEPRKRYDFRGRVIQIAPAMDSDGTVYKSVICEGFMGFLNDSIQPYADTRQYTGDDSRNGLQEFIDVLLENHNAQVEPHKQIRRGNVTLTTYETSGGVYKGLNFETTWDCIKSKLLDVFGGEIALRESGGELYLDYAESLGTTRATKIELGRNMQSANRTIDCASVVSRLIPLGAKLTQEVTDEQGNVSYAETEERLTIESINDGQKYIESETAVELFGIIYGVQIFDDITEPTNLRERGAAWLAQNNMLTESNSIASLDLSLIGLDIDDIALYDSYPVRNDLIGLNAILKVIKKTTDVIEPYASTFDMGDRALTMADSVLDLDRVYTDIQGDIRKTVETSERLQHQSIVTIVSQTVQTSLQQSEEDIVARVAATTVSESEYQTFKETVSTILQMDENGVAMIFETINESIEQVGETAQTNYAEILKYIRFEDGNIILGEQGNPLTLKIENDRIAFLQNGVAVAYFSDSKLYVTSGEFLRDFRIGRFQAEPRQNGNTTWKVVG